MGQHLYHKLSVAVKNTGLIGLIAVFGLVATGCSLPWSSNSTPTGPKQIQVRVWRTNQDIDSFRDFIKDFQKAHPTVTVTYSKKNTEGYELAALKSEAGRLGPDIWSIPNDWIGDYQDQIVPLPDNFFYAPGATTGVKPVDAVKQYYPSGIYDQLISPDRTKVYGLPTNVDTLQLYINQTLFDQALLEFKQSQGEDIKDEVYQPVRQLLSRPPTTWNDVVDQVKYLTKRSGSTITRSGIALGTANNIPASEDILQLLINQNGSKILSDDRKSPLFQTVQSTPSGGQVRPGEKALDFFTSFSNPAKTTYSWNPSMPQALDAFGQGKVAMVLAYSDFGKQLKVKYPKFDFGTYPVPQVSSAQAPVNFINFSVETVTKTADNTAAAFAFMKTYVDEPQARSLASEQKLYDPFISYLNNNKDTFQINQILSGTAVYKVNHNQFDAIFQQMIVDSSQNGISPADAIKTGADKIDELLNPPPAP